MNLNNFGSKLRISDSGRNPENKEKQLFSERFNNRLHGEKVEPHNFTESQLFKLVGMFEQQYPRTDFPKVYESLYAIQQGQTNSLKLMRQ